MAQSGWVVEALQGAWSAITMTRGQGRYATDHLRLGLESAMRGGGDTDTVQMVPTARPNPAFEAALRHRVLTGSGDSSRAG
jgi:ADP-ribosyl-[dinitrogen reductase] hydrolase